MHTIPSSESWCYYINILFVISAGPFGYVRNMHILHGKLCLETSNVNDILFMGLITFSI